MPFVFISILNWNGANSTLECLKAVLATTAPYINIKVVILDNGSRNDDWQNLCEGCVGLNVQIVRQEINTGFAAGHNIVMRLALEHGADYIWLLNNDAIVAPETLDRLLAAMQGDSHLGAVSPLIYARHDPSVVDFCGAIHDWKTQNTICAKDRNSGIELQRTRPSDFYISGAAPLIKLEALRNIGLLDENLFAYYEDNDLCVRFALNGWRVAIAPEASILHTRHQSYYDDRPPYHFYLMARNAILFFVKHTPPRQRKLLRTRLFARSMIKAAILEQKGYKKKANAVLIGTLHGLKNIGGPPRHDDPAPVWLRLIAKIFPYRLQQWLG